MGIPIDVSEKDVKSIYKGNVSFHNISVLYFINYQKAETPSLEDFQ